MSEFTMCQISSCVSFYSCHRAMAEPNPYNQTYFNYDPRKKHDARCSFFMPLREDLVRDFKVWEPSQGMSKTDSVKVRAFDAEQAAEEYSKAHHGNHVNETIKNINVFDVKADELTKWDVSVAQSLRFHAQEVT